jgi:hypothetical protein
MRTKRNHLARRTAPESRGTQRVHKIAEDQSQARSSGLSSKALTGIGEKALEYASADERIVTAYHEAGHAIAQYVLHLPFRSVSIVPDNTTLGRLKITSAESQNLLQIGAKDVDCVIIAALAGRAAEERYEGSTFDWNDDDGDLQYAAKVACRVQFHIERDDLPVYLLGCWERARNLIRRHWRNTQKIAKLLLVQDELSSDDVHNVVEPVKVSSPLWRISAKDPLSTAQGTTVFEQIMEALADARPF